MHKLSLFLSAWLFISVANAQEHNDVHQLENGFRYVIKQTRNAQNSISFRLVLNVGSLQEQDEEEGVAHFIEHMAFYRTKKYPEKRAVVRQLESFGQRYGITFNAYTGYDRTIYLFSLPADMPDAVSLGIDIAKEWLCNIMFEHADVQQEIPVILQEIANNVPTDCFDSIRKGENKKLHRTPLGTEQQVRRINVHTLKKFYRKFYRPENAALIIAGKNIEEEKTSKEIDKAFGALKRYTHERTIEEQLSFPSQTHFASCPNNQIRHCSIDWTFPLKTDTLITIQQLKKKYIEDCILAMINTRLRKKKSALRISRQWYLSNTDHLNFSISNEDEKELLHDFEKGIAVLQGISLKGFAQEEVQEQLQALHDELQHINFDKSADEWCDYFIDGLLTNTFLLNSQQQADEIKRKLENLPLEAWNVSVKKLPIGFNKHSIVAYRYNPSRHKNISYPSLQRVISQASSSPDTSAAAPSVRKDPILDAQSASILRQPIHYSPQMIDSFTQYPSLKIQDFYLKNGARLILKKTENTDSMVSVNVLFKGGLSATPPEKYPLLEASASYMSMGGLAQMKSDEYTDVLYHHNLSLVHTISSYWHGLLASCKKDNTNMLANLISYRCFSPERCYTEFEEIRKDLREKSKSEPEKATGTLSAEKMLQERIEQYAGQALPYTRNIKPGEIDLLNLDSMAQFYNNTYTHANGLTCIVVGNFEEDIVASQFIGMLSRFKKDSIPLYLHTKESNPLEANEMLLIEKQKEDAKSKRIRFHKLYVGNYPTGLRQTIKLNIMQRIIQNRVIDKLRHSLGFVYSPYVDLSFSAFPKPLFCLDINGITDSLYTSRIFNEINALVAQIQKENMATEEINHIKKSILLTKEKFLTETAVSNWQTYLSDCMKNGSDINNLENYHAIIQSITPNEILHSLKEILGSAHSVFLYIHEDR